MPTSRQSIKYSGHCRAGREGLDELLPSEKYLQVQGKKSRIFTGRLRLDYLARPRVPASQPRGSALAQLTGINASQAALLAMTSHSIAAWQPARNPALPMRGSSTSRGGRGDGAAAARVAGGDEEDRDRDGNT